MGTSQWLLEELNAKETIVELLTILLYCWSNAQVGFLILIIGSTRQPMTDWCLECRTEFVALLREKASCNLLLLATTKGAFQPS
jgi:hypothetical protein